MKSTGSEAKVQPDAKSAGGAVSELRPARRADDRGPSATDELIGRIEGVERSNRRLKILVLVLLVGLVYMMGADYITQNPIVRQTLMESRELKLLDNDGNPRMFVRMYSKVPVMQLLDRNGKPRLSMGLRFDDTPFLDLSDRTGRTRATLEMTGDDAPTLQLFDENGETSFKIQ